MSRPRAADLLRPILVSVTRLGVLGLALAAAGCASNQAAQPPAHVAGPAPNQAAGAWKVEIEEDGRPAQPPPVNTRRIPDDPREPWSPNYGNRGPAKAASAVPAPEVPPERMIRPRPQPPHARVTIMDEDALIRRAIAEHEMRRHD